LLRLARSGVLLSIFFCVLLVAACSDDDGDAAVPPTPTPAATATQEAASTASIQGTVTVDFTGAPQELEALDVSFEVAPESTAWDAIKLALGEENLTFMDFGGDLGIFISGFNGVNAEGNNFWEFKINGEGAEVGVSKYQVQQGDVLSFVYSSF
jgi:hypothetical protein